ncbi:hypothetical protein KIW84_073072 [Lathyrus oleraceus]|uniref:CCHC-type domain-containing protein n=1 Tax=Pisum sativum TaxID=3888 RepID=A0A9D4VMN5_PEA|nr:hypothetical protein KIW84_073072 [Pisum sativum]
MVYEQDHIDSILDGLPEEYNSFVMQMYSAPDPQYLYDVESFLYVQEAHHDKFYQHGISHGSGRFSPGNQPTCQLCGKYGHVRIDCWHHFDDHFTPTQAHTKPRHFSNMSSDKLEASTYDPQALSLISTANEYSLPWVHFDIFILWILTQSTVKYIS